MSKMNKEEKSIRFLMDLYEPCAEYVIEDGFLKDGPFGHFVARDLTKKDVLGMMAKAARERFGRDVVRKRGGSHRLAYHLKAKADFNEGEWIASWRSTDFATIEEASNYPSGSKICFSRQSSVSGSLTDLYVHTGILLHIGGDPFIVELQKAEGAPRTIVNKAYDVLGDFNRAVFVDNTYLVGKSIDLKDMLYRLSRIVNAPVAYDATRLNCDVVATYLASGRVRWVTKTCLCYSISKTFPKFNFTLPTIKTDSLSRRDLLDVENSSPKLRMKNITDSVVD